MTALGLAGDALVVAADVLDGVAVCGAAAAASGAAHKSHRDVAICL